MRSKQGQIAVIGRGLGGLSPSPAPPTNELNNNYPPSASAPAAFGPWDTRDGLSDAAPPGSPPDSERSDDEPPSPPAGPAAAVPLFFYGTASEKLEGSGPSSPWVGSRAGSAGGGPMVIPPPSPKAGSRAGAAGGGPPSSPKAGRPAGTAGAVPPSSPKAGSRAGSAGGVPPSSPKAGSPAGPGAGGVVPKIHPPLSPKARSRAGSGASGVNMPVPPLSPKSRSRSGSGFLGAPPKAPPSSPKAGSRAGSGVGGPNLPVPPSSPKAGSRAGSGVGGANLPVPPSSPRAGSRAAGQPTLDDREGRDSAKEKGKSSGPSARKGKGQIEKRKLREKRRSTGVVNIPAEHLDDYEDDEADQKERKREDAITQENTIKNEASVSDPEGLSLETSRPISRRSIIGEDDVSSQHPRLDWSGSWLLSKDSSNESIGILEQKIETLEKNIVAERKENLRLQKMIEDKEETIGKLKEEINLLNRDLDDTEDENEQLKQENKTLLKVVGQLTR